ncbi:MBL fold metallo-hydrolase [Rhodovulum euryhalinum]|uniref:Cft2 family RNA processing exonuclease n=1 Tax=Rhodovulum euryhalinum TaxID=35805 RepID=A0A4R2KSY2_9RHOB|nr:MBL fold metallo-hydrolase [Rhodovulum euryhalinum]TCO74166.1 Cft2 family RNA processing exonuclease [Rhodovulum euryhalinum]
MPRLVALSGFDAKGPACFLLELGGARLMLDLGTGPDAGRLPDLAGVGPVDAILLSHGHADHAGALQLAPLVGSPPVHASPPVFVLSGPPPGPVGVALPRRGRVEIVGVEVETGAAGHAPGAVWMRIGGAGGLLYTGDCATGPSVWPFEMPPPAEAVVLDASYGVADTALAVQQAELLGLLSSAPVLLPSPADGRGLDIACAALAAGVGVALCPAHRRVAETLLARPDWLADGAAGTLRDLLAKASPLDVDSPARGAMIAVSADAASGLSAPLAARFAVTGEARILFTGYLGAGTPAAALVCEGHAGHMRWNVHPRLSDTRALLAATKPRVAMPAFCPPHLRAALAAALPGAPFCTGPEMTW